MKRAAVKQVAMPEPAEKLTLQQEHKLRRELRELREQLRAQVGTVVLNQEYQQFVAEVAKLRAAPPAWCVKAKPHRARQAIPLLHLSDAHFDEVVDAAQVGGLNCYTREIALGRLRRFFEKGVAICDDYLKGVDYPGVVCAVSGDMFSGSIHEELKETNEAGLCESLRYWIDPLYAGIQMLAERFGKVRVPWVVGNHPRLEKKPRAKGGVRDNFDWLLGSMLARDFARAGDKRVTFEISDSFDHQFNVYGLRVLQTHGDQFRGGGGISAALSPWFIGDARKRERYQAVKQPYDVLIMGHWHWRVCLPSIKGNGSLKGIDEYAYRGNFKFQEPVQSLMLVTPEHGITIEAPIFVKAEKEGWER